jgi:hypothetical protein
LGIKKKEISSKELGNIKIAEGLKSLINNQIQKKPGIAIRKW